MVKHKKTNFFNSVFCMGLYPTITHPSRITTNTATLVDNILTNVTEGNLTRGLLINDVSDHLPVFIACCLYPSKKLNRVKTEIKQDKRQ